MDSSAQKYLDDEAEEGESEEDDYDQVDSFIDDEAEEDDQDDDQDEQEDVEMDQNNANTPAKTNGSNKSKLYSLPTNEEMQELKGTSDLFKSNIFKLQIDELLKEVRLDYNMPSLDKVLRAVKEAIDVHPEVRESDLATAKKHMLKKHGIAIPFPNPPPAEDVLYKFAYQKPVATHLVGSYPLQTIAKSTEKFSVDMAVVMPKALFQEKDHLNYRYFHKRAFFLANIAAALKKLPLNISVAHLNNDPRRPCLLINSQKDSNMSFSKCKCNIRIIPSIEADTFPLGRLAPGRNNIRSSEADDTPTPLYNNSLLQDTAHVAHLSFIYKHLKSCAGFRDACLMGNVWLNQRGFSSKEGQGGTGHFFFAMLLSLLLESGGSKGKSRLGHGYSSYQLFKGVIDYLATHDFEKPASAAKAPGIEYALEAFTANFQVVLVGPTATVNFAGGMTKADAAKLQHHARITLQYLNDTIVDRFEAIFLRRLSDPMRVYDMLVRLAIPSDYESTNLDSPSAASSFARQVDQILRRALSNRIKLLTIWQDNDSGAIWDLKTSTPATTEGVINVGLLLEPTRAGRLVDHGPPADSSDVNEFRKFWGDKAETRRFKDGSILESVVWDVKNADERYGIPERIVRYVLGLHLALTEVHCWSRQLSSLIRLPKAAAPLFGDVVAASAFPAAVAAFDGLVKKLKSYEEDVPLGITNVAATSAGLRYTSVLPPRPVDVASFGALPPSARYIYGLEGVITFERSGRWPEDLVAIQKTKLAFLLAFREKLEREAGIQHAAVALEHGTGLDWVDSGYLEVVDESGYAFKLRIFHYREYQLFEERIEQEKNRTEKERSRAIIEQKRWELEYLPVHATTINTLASKRFPNVFSGATRLVKRWLSAQMIAERQMPGELVETICAHVFLDPSPYGTAPGSATAGFIRILEFLSNWDWRREPLIVDFGQDETSYDEDQVVNMDASRRQEIVKMLETHRREDPSMKSGCMYVITSIAGSRASVLPCRMVATRITQLAKAAVKVFREVSRENTWEDVMKMNGIGMQLFTPSLSDYDFELELDYAAMPRYYESIDADSKVLKMRGGGYRNLAVGRQEGQGQLPIDFDPIREYIYDLERIYRDSAAFFYDTHGGKSIYGVWNPLLLTRRPWKVNLGYNSTADDDNKGKRNVSLNTDAALAEMQRIGHGIVKRVVQL